MGKVEKGLFGVRQQGLTRLSHLFLGIQGQGTTVASYSFCHNYF